MPLLAILTVSAAFMTADLAPHQEVEDDSWTQQAAAACQHGTFSDFFEAFVYSPVVRRQYSRPILEQLTLQGRPSNRASHQASEAFAISGVDYNFGETRSVERWQAGEIEQFTRLKVDQHTLADGSVRVDYQPGEFVEDEEGDGSEFVRATGPAAAYIFQKTSRCWRLTQQLR